MAQSHDRFQHSVAPFRDGVRNIRQDIVKLKVSNAQYASSVNQLTEELNVLRNEKEKLLQSLEKCASEMCTLRDEREISEQKLHEAQKEIDSSSRYVIQLESDLKCSLAENTKLKTLLESLDYELKHIEQKYFVLIQDKKSLQEKCDFYRDELEQKNVELEAKCAEIRKQEKSQKEFFATISAERTNLEEKLKEVSESCRENENKYKNTIDDMKAMSLKNQMLQTGMIKKYKTLSMKTQQMNMSQDEQLKQLKEENTALSLEVEKYHATQAELNRLKLKHEEVLRALEQLTDEVGQYQMQNEKLQSTLNEMEEMETSLNESIDELSFANKSSQIQMRRLEEAGLNKQNSYEETVVQLKNKIHRLTKDDSQTRDELTVRRKEISELKKDNLDKIFKIQELERQLKEKDTIILAKRMGDINFD